MYCSCGFLQLIPACMPPPATDRDMRVVQTQPGGFAGGARTRSVLECEPETQSLWRGSSGMCEPLRLDLLSTVAGRLCQSQLCAQPLARCTQGRRRVITCLTPPVLVRSCWARDNARSIAAREAGWMLSEDE
eukprot:3642327-Rhodomonas_salina.1